MVASRANTKRPLAPAACGDIACAFATKAAIASEVEVFASGNEPDSAAFWTEVTSADLLLVGSRDNRPSLAGGKPNLDRLVGKGYWVTAFVFVFSGSLPSGT